MACVNDTSIDDKLESVKRIKVEVEYNLSPSLPATEAQDVGIVAETPQTDDTNSSYKVVEAVHEKLVPNSQTKKERKPTPRIILPGCPIIAQSPSINRLDLTWPINELLVANKSSFPINNVSSNEVSYSYHITNGLIAQSTIKPPLVSSINNKPEESNSISTLRFIYPVREPFAKSISLAQADAKLVPTIEDGSTPRNTCNIIKHSSPKNLNLTPTSAPKRPQSCSSLNRNRRFKTISKNFQVGPVSVKNADTDRQLMEAARSGDSGRVKQLVENYCGPYSSDWSGTTALHIAAQNGHKDIVEILLIEGANQDARTKVDRTALHIAAQYGHLEVVDLLINYWSDVNAIDMLKMSPLHWAADHGHTSVVERLLQAGADMTLESKFFLTPVDIAYNTQSYDMIDIFRNYSANISGFLYPIEKPQIQHESKPQLAIEPGLMDESQSEQIDLSCITPVRSTSASHGSELDLEEPCIDFLELEWSKLELPPDFLLETEDEEDEPQVEYLMKIVEELQKENKHLRLQVEQLSTDT